MLYRPAYRDGSAILIYTSPSLACQYFDTIGRMGLPPGLLLLLLASAGIDGRSHAAPAITHAMVIDDSPQSSPVNHSIRLRRSFLVAGFLPFILVSAPLLLR